MPYRLGPMSPTPSHPGSGFLIPGPAGALEALYHEAAGVERPRAVAVVCHPHPEHGGNMNSTVAFRTARGLESAGLAVLRINFRGVGASEGSYDGEGAEEGDALAALEWLAEQHPGAPWWAGGFSFGSRTVFGLAKREPRIERLVLVGFPMRMFELDRVDELRQPTFFIWGDQDEYGTRRDLLERYPVLPPHFTTHEIPGGDHFFKGHSKELEQRVHAWAEAQLGSARP